jgi:very-short-patch-repair endonuclease
MGYEFDVLLVEQSDVFSVAQARANGVSYDAIRARLDSGRWQRVSAGIVVAHGGPLSDQSMLWAALLSCGPLSLICHDSAAHLQGVLIVPPAVIHICVPWSHRCPDRPGIQLHRSRIARRQAKGRHPPQVCVEDTVLDRSDDAATADAVVGFVVTAILKGATTPALLRASLARRARARWRDLLNDLLDDGAGIESTLEWRYRRDVERRHALPEGVRQDVVATAAGRERRDVLYKAQRLVVELDGRLGHDGDNRFKDMRRDNSAAARGETCLRYGWSDVASRPCQVAAQVAEILQLHGWSGVMRRCSDCRD